MLHACPFGCQFPCRSDRPATIWAACFSAPWRSLQTRESGTAEFALSISVAQEGFGVSQKTLLGRCDFVHYGLGGGSRIRSREDRTADYEEVGARANGFRGSGGAGLVVIFGCG